MLSFGDGIDGRKIEDKEMKEQELAKSRKKDITQNKRRQRLKESGKVGLSNMSDKEKRNIRRHSRSDKSCWLILRLPA